MTTVDCVLDSPDAPQPCPMFTACAAAKTAVVSFTEKPVVETARDGISVTRSRAPTRQVLPLLPPK